MPTLILPTHKLYFNGTVFIPRNYSYFFVITTCLFILIACLFPANADSMYSHILQEPVVKPAKAHENIAVYIKQSNKLLANEEALDFAKHIVDSADTFKLDLHVFLAVIKIESSFKPDAISNMGASGLTQVMPKYHQDKITAARKVINAYSIFEPKLNVYVGAWVLRDFINASTSMRQGLLRYNGSLKDRSEHYANLVLTEAYAIASTTNISPRKL